MTFFQNLKETFKDVPSNQRIETQTFIDATISMLPFLDHVGPFGKMKGYMTQNATNLQKKYEADREKYTTLQSFVEDEKEKGTTKPKDSATTSLMFLRRGLWFIQAMFEEILTQEPVLSTAVGKAYEKSVKRYHGWFIQKAFGLVLRAVSTREKFIASIGNGAPEEEVLKEMALHLDLITKNLAVLKEFYEKMEEDRSDKF
eukprot:Seg827.9 transcript_id=Seg827.9/GoldUCD/mRNA.D3Y31 product="Glycolipid transfer protein" protein_id=Seg827.9/GoldUCD/D3Y31